MRSSSLDILASSTLRNLNRRTNSIAVKAGVSERESTVVLNDVQRTNHSVERPRHDPSLH